MIRCGTSKERQCNGANRSAIKDKQKFGLQLTTTITKMSEIEITSKTIKMTKKKTTTTIITKTSMKGGQCR